MNYSSSRRQKKRWQSVRRINVVDWCVCVTRVSGSKTQPMVVSSSTITTTSTTAQLIETLFFGSFTHFQCQVLLCAPNDLYLPPHPPDLSWLKLNPRYESKKVLYFDEPSRAELLDQTNVAKWLQIGLSAAVIPSSFYLVLLGLTSSVAQNKIVWRRRRRRKTPRKEERER